MSPKVKRFGAVLCLMAMAFFAGWPFWSWFNKRAASATLQARARGLVEKNPRLEPAWAIALQDGVLTAPEARVIVEAAGEKFESPE